MSSPMSDLPEHLVMPVNEAGEGPAEEATAFAFVCWCGWPGCRLYETEDGILWDASSTPR